MQTIIITGGNSGLGYEVAKQFALNGKWHVVVASRNQKRIDDAIQRLRQETGHTAFSAMVLDLADLASVRQFAKQFSETSLPPLHSIICNAGLNPARWQHTKNGFDQIFGVNHLGHFLLVNLLLKHLNTPSSIVFVSSGTHVPEHRLARIMGVPAPKYVKADYLAHPETAPEHAKLRNTFQAYSTSKLCNVLCANALSQRLVDEGFSPSDCPIRIFAIDPGLMPDTGLVRDLPEFLQSIFAGVIKGIEPFVKGIRLPAQSGHDVYRLVTNTSLGGQNASYFDGDTEGQSSADSYNIDFQRDLWETSISLTQLQPHETILSIGSSH